MSKKGEKGADGDLPTETPKVHIEESRGLVESLLKAK